VTYLLIILSCLAIVGLISVAVYNNLIRARLLVRESWSGIDVQLRRRHDLIPTLVKSVQGYAHHEKEVFEKIALARTRAEATSYPSSTELVENQISELLGQLFVVAENYPQLIADNNFIKLQNELSNTEAEIAAARSIYNSNVRGYNQKIKSFPSLLLANASGFSPAEFFMDADVGEAFSS
jgi:LemA protein